MNKSSKDINREYYKTYWNVNMISYLNHSGGARWFNYLLDLFLNEIPKNSLSSIADVGCGVGNKTAHMAQHFPKSQVFGFDFSKEGIAAASKYHKEKNLSFSTKDITAIAHSKKYDLVTAFDVLEHIDDWKKLTKELIDVNGKYLLISSPVGKMRPYEVHIGHVRNFERLEIESFLENNGYKTVKTLYAGFPFYSPILRDLTNIFYKDYAALPTKEMSFISKRWHDVWYVLFRYFSLKNKGDIFIGLFEKAEETVKK